jgi:hypothetical protein
MWGVLLLEHDHGECNSASQLGGAPLQALARLAATSAPDRLLARPTAGEFEAPVIPSVGIA